MSSFALYTGPVDAIQKKELDIASFYMDDVDISFTSGLVTVPFNKFTVNSNNAMYNLNSGELTIMNSDIYKISYSVGIELVGNNRTTSEVCLQVDDGSGWAVVPGTFSYGYHRNRTSDHNTASCSFAIDVSAGVKIKVVTRRKSGRQTLKLIPNASSLLISKTGLK